MRDCKQCQIRKKYTDMNWRLCKKEQPPESDRYLIKSKNGWIDVGYWWNNEKNWRTDDDDCVMLTAIIKWMPIPK